MKFNPIIKNVKREKLIRYFIKHKIFTNKNFIKKLIGGQSIVGSKVLKKL